MKVHFGYEFSKVLSLNSPNPDSGKSEYPDFTKYIVPTSKLLRFAIISYSKIIIVNIPQIQSQYLNLDKYFVLGITKNINIFWQARNLHFYLGGVNAHFETNVCVKRGFYFEPKFPFRRTKSWAMGAPALTYLTNVNSLIQQLAYKKGSLNMPT